jgi:hypothetical protein
MIYTCENSKPLVVVKSGEVISYVPPTATNQNFQYQKTICEVTDGAIPETATVFYTFTEGELIISLMLLGLFLITLFDLLYRQFVGVRLRRMP